MTENIKIDKEGKVAAMTPGSYKPESICAT